MYPDNPKEFTPARIAALDHETFLQQARAYAQSKYGYGEFADDCEDGIPAAIAADETPEYWIERLAEKYDLEPISKGYY